MFKYINLGLNLVMPAFVGLVIGVFADKWLSTGSVMTLIFLLLGIVSGFWSLYKEIKNMEQGE
jgi:F0F1-type ATP synthase assembly protein I